ncbi:MAG: hypothetical protein AAGE94_20075, partial [Acidobacteriota bacterium]
RVLYVDPATGAADLDRATDGTLLAAMWQHRRQPWSFVSGGPGSGIYRSTDEGDTWQRLGTDAGLPAGLLGRVGLAFAPSDPRIAYAFVEHDGPTHRLIRSEDGGATWTTVADSSTQPIGTRPFYYADLRVDPQDPDRVYSLWTALSVSEDGGRTWRTIAPFTSVHADHHALWIAPDDPTLIYDGNDGGVAVSRSRGETWRYVENLPLKQFYHVRVDDAVPYNVYGGTQDNGSWFGPSAVHEATGIRAAHWREVGPGDGFDTVPIPGEPGRGYALMPGGLLSRFDARSGGYEVVRPEAPAGEPDLRYGWDAPIELDPFDPDGLFFGSQFVHHSADRGATWMRISPDLTSDRAAWQGFRETGGLTIDVSSAESYTTLSTIAASRRQRNLLWVGSDDGRLHRTTDGGTTWTRLDGELPEAPEHGRFTSIVISDTDPAVAYVALEAHGFGDDTPYLYRTDDHGRSWTRLGRELDGWIHVVVEDPEEPRLLFVGTERGLWLSIDHGTTWQPFRAGLPRAVPVRDLAIQERESALVIATHGRGLYVVDHLRPLRDLVDLVASDAPVALARITSAIRHTRGRPPGARFPGDGTFEARNPPYGVSLYLWLRQSIDSTPRITITASRHGRVVRTLTGPSSAGLHRVVWNLQPDSPVLPNGQSISSFEVLPDRYTVRVQWAPDRGESSDELPTESLGVVDVLPDPRLGDIPIKDREARRAAVEQGVALLDDMLGAIVQSQALGTQLDALRQARSTDAQTVGTARLDALSDRLAELSAQLINPPDKHSRYRDRVFDEVLKAVWVLEQSVRAPASAQLRYLERAEAIARPFLADLQRLSHDVDAVHFGVDGESTPKPPAHPNG